MTDDALATHAEALETYLARVVPGDDVMLRDGAGNESRFKVDSVSMTWIYLETEGEPSEARISRTTGKTPAKTWHAVLPADWSDDDGWRRDNAALHPLRVCTMHTGMLDESQAGVGRIRRLMDDAEAVLRRLERWDVDGLVTIPRAPIVECFFRGSDGGTKPATWGLIVYYQDKKSQDKAANALVTSMGKSDEHQ